MDSEHIDRNNPVFETDATVAIDARYLTGEGSGIGRYTQNLIAELLKIDSEISLHLITHPNSPEPFEHPRVTSQVFRASANGLRTRYVLPRFLDFDKIDLFHSPFNILPSSLEVPSIFTLHDIMWVLDADYCTRHLWQKVIEGTFFKTMIPKAVSEADRILTVSKNSKKEIEDYFPGADGDVDVAYHGVDPYFSPMSPADGWPLLEKYMPPRSKFVLVVGQGSPYKNHEGALAGFLEAFKDEPDVYFVLIRRLGKNPSPRLEELMERPEIASRIIQLDYVPIEQLRAFYSLARAFLFPSFYEGFGLPSLEAMACGTPVVASNRGAPDEVGGEAAIKVNPDSSSSIARGLTKLFEDDDFYRQKRDEALNRAAKFTWRRCAIETARSYRKVLNE